MLPSGDAQKKFFRTFPGIPMIRIFFLVTWQVVKPENLNKQGYHHSDIVQRHWKLVYPEPLNISTTTAK